MQMFAIKNVNTNELAHDESSTSIQAFSQRDQAIAQAHNMPGYIVVRLKTEELTDEPSLKQDSISKNVASQIDVKKGEHILIPAAW